MALSDVQIYVAPHLHNRMARIRIWERTLGHHGATIQANLEESVTHIIIEEGSPDLQTLTEATASRHSLAPRLVTPEWLTDSLSKRKRQQEDKYTVSQSKPEEQVPGKQLKDTYWDDEDTQYKPLPDLGRWLGHWSRSLETNTDHTELMLHAIYSIDRCKEAGNQEIVDALHELRKYEAAIDVDRTEDQPDSEHLNFRALKCARAAASVQACSYEIDESLRPGQLPYVGESVTRQIQQLLLTGSFIQLEQFRNDELVQDSAGELRPGTAGGHTRAMFRKLPGVGTRMALQWWDRGFRSFEDVEEACRPGGEFDGHRNGSTITREAEFSLIHRDELLEAGPAADAKDMEAAVLKALESAAGPGWRLIPVGGAVRGMPSHDIDFLVTHDSNLPAEGVVRDVAQRLQQEGKLWPKDSHAMCRIQTGRMPGHVDRMKSYFLHGSKTVSNLSADRFDHLFGMFKTAGGKVRRMDLIFVPPEELPFATLGWIGSTQFLRFMRLHAANIGMHLNSHRLLAKDPGQQKAWVVPDEGPPLNKEGKPAWPPGWNDKRRAQHERDVFELMCLPYHPPEERNCH